VIKNISHNGPAAVQEVKRLLRFVTSAPAAQVKIESVRTIADRRVSDEGQEGIASFLQKRKPAWIKG
jgi:methylglutaconyl-CoA hydratase